MTVSSTVLQAGEAVRVSGPEFFALLQDGWIVDPAANRGNLICLHRQLVRLP